MNGTPEDAQQTTDPQTPEAGAAPSTADGAGTVAAGPASSGEDASETESPEAAEAADGDAEVSEAEALRAKLEEARQERDEINDRLLRTAAEMQNVRRRGAEEQRRRATQAKSAALRPMLEVLDDLQRALAAADDSAPESAGSDGDAFTALRDGVEMVGGKFEQALAGLGVEPIVAEGVPFDESVHEAMMRQPAPEGTTPGTVLAEVRRGYRMEASGEDEPRVLRHSRVVVASEPEPPADAQDQEAVGDAEE